MICAPKTFRVFKCGTNGRETQAGFGEEILGKEQAFRKN